VEPDRLLSIGKVVGVHGLKGALKVASHAESPDAFAAGRTLILMGPGESGNNGGERSRAIEWVKPHQRGLLVGLEGVADRTAAESLVGAHFYIRRSELPPPEEGAYYWADLIGLTVIDAEDHRLGRLTAILPTGSNDVYVVRDGGEEILVPALASVVIDIDLTSRTMRVDLPEGL
jgi:16S rRNA processing protein RimM